MEKLKPVYKFISNRGNLTLLFFIAVSLAITWATIGQIEYNYRLEQRARTLEEEVAVLRQQNINQDLRNEFFETNYYLELSARRQLGLVSPGEKVAIINRQDIEAVLAEFPEEPEEIAAETIETNASPIEQWFRFFSGKQPL